MAQRSRFQPQAAVAGLNKLRLVHAKREYAPPRLERGEGFALQAHQGLACRGLRGAEGRGERRFADQRPPIACVSDLTYEVQRAETSFAAVPSGQADRHPEESVAGLQRKAAEEVARVLSGQPPQNWINRGNEAG